ncbi:MAG: DUF1801 domain-containing protein [Maribacter sp.]|uniref:YdeI/OmpD-associated family protein n=1 Tax=Maribacter sp. TaxID=1897614 RepID=UPI003C769A85
MHDKVASYLEHLKRWQPELRLLHTIVVDCGLQEDFKWMHPCYTYTQKNIVLLQDFKDYCALLFPKGVLLKDTENILVAMTANVQSARQLRFTHIDDIVRLEPILKAYIFEAIEVEKAGLKVKLKDTSDFEVPEALTRIFAGNAAFEAAFNALTPGRQKGYLLHFSQPKQAKTREARIVRNMERIIDGYGLNDCVCGLSKRMPNCDGSHKQLEKN